MSDLWNAIHFNNSGPNSNSLPHPNLGDLSAMPWSTPNHNNVMEFTGIAPVTNTAAISRSSHPPLLHTKRKPDVPDDPPVPSKRMITEDSMAEHLSNLHISGSSRTGGCPETELSNYSVNMTQWDLERKLRTAQKITVCNEILELDKGRDAILPEILLNRIAKPCSALMLWQPPTALTNLIDVQIPAASTDTAGTQPGKGGEEDEEEMET